MKIYTKRFLNKYSIFQVCSHFKLDKFTLRYMFRIEPILEVILLKCFMLTS